ncbi:MAG: hypothetical protein QXX08_02465 [Candidatus Bathyarchaeia archaeon]
MRTERNSTLKKIEVEGEFPEQNQSVKKLVETLIKSFLKSDSDYGAIADINTDVNQVYQIVRNYVNEEKLDVYALKLEDRILLSKTNIGFEAIYEIVKSHSHLQQKKNMIEIWDDAENKILHLIIFPLRKHFPIEYSTEKEKEKLTEEISTMTLTF